MREERRPLFLAPMVVRIGMGLLPFGMSHLSLEALEHAVAEDIDLLGRAAILAVLYDTGPAGRDPAGSDAAHCVLRKAGPGAGTRAGIFIGVRS